MAEQAAATIRYFGAARAAAGTAQEKVTVSDAVTIALVLASAVERHGPKLAKVLPRCSYLLDAIAVHDTAAPVSDGQILDILPPFAGG